MSHHEHDEKEKEQKTNVPEGSCDNIQDPVRRGLCKLCEQPVVGETPFCTDHQPEVP